MKILIVRFSSIGDIVLTTPVIRCVKQQVPNAEVHFMSKKAFESILKENPYIDKLHLIKNKVNELKQELINEDFDFVVDLHKNIRSAQVKSICETKSASFNKLNVEKWLMVRFKWNRLPNVHIVDRYMETVSTLGVKNDGKGLDYFIPEADEVDIKETLSLDEDYIAFAIGGQHVGKMLPKEKIISICAKIEKPVLLLGGKEDASRAEHIAKRSGKHVHSVTGSFNLNQSASILKQAQAVITHDTGLMHIASALKKKVISIWGCTIPEFGMSPYMPGEGSKIIEVKEAPSRPCSKLGKGMCKDFACMNMIDEWQLVEAL